MRKTLKLAAVAGDPSRFVAPIYGPRRYVQRCTEGTHKTGGRCNHTGGAVIAGSCFVALEKRSVLVGRMHSSGTHYVLTIEEVR
jgi:hypothetical protein